MSLYTWEEALVTQQAAGTLFATFTTAKTVINPQALFTLPAGYMSIGKKLRVLVQGAISNLVTTPGTINFQVKFGSAVVFDTGAIQLNATAHTTLPFWLDIELTCRALGDATNANMMGQALAIGRMFTLTAGQTDDAQGMQTILAPATAPAVGAGFNSTIANIVDFFAGFSISNAANGVQIQQYSVEARN